MKKSVAAAVLAASLAGTGAGALLAGPEIVSAATADDTTEDVAGEHPRLEEWVGDAIAPLVEDGTITQPQADAVVDAISEAAPEFGPRGHRHHRGPAFGIIAETLGMTEEELRDALAAGSTIAEVAEAQGVSIDDVVAAVLADLEAHLDELVEAGEMTEEEKDERLAAAEERITAMVNGEMPEGGPGHGPRPRGRRG